MRGVYVATIDISALGAAKTLILIEATSAICVEILSASVGNLTNETNEQLEVGLYRVTTKGTPAGTTITPLKSENGDQAAACTVLGNLTEEPTTYASFGLDMQGIASLSGYRYDPMPEERPLIPPSGLIGLRMISAPTSFDANAKIVFREIG